jgi:hypothetical protein
MYRDGMQETTQITLREVYILDIGCMYHYIILMTQQDIINKLNEPLTK